MSTIKYSKKSIFVKYFIYEVPNYNYNNIRRII